MKKFLAIDTSSKYLTVIAFNEKPTVTFLPDCAMSHSVTLMDAIEDTLARANLTAAECDFFACSVGAGSFTGIRIGIATIKGFALAFQKPVLGVTSFECIAYTNAGRVFSVIDALHDHFYVCGFDEEKKVILPPCYLTKEQTLALQKEGKLLSFEDFSFETQKVNMAEGLLAAVIAKQNETKEVSSLTALYVRKSQAEETMG